MDVCSFFNSRDVERHLRVTGRELTAAEAAYVVWLSDAATLEEKVDAWQEIVDTMPDCPVCPSSLDQDPCEEPASEHLFLRELIYVRGLALRWFLRDDEGYVYLLTRARLAPRSADGFRRNEHSPWVVNLSTKPLGIPFSSFAACADAIRAGDGTALRFDRYQVEKIAIDGGRRRGRADLDDRLRVLDVTVSDLCPGYDTVESRLAFSFVELPVPFKRGDIVIDRTSREPRPFVFDRLEFWDSAELAAHGHVLSAEQARDVDVRLARRRAQGGGDGSWMSARGWSLAPGSPEGARDACLLIYGPVDASGSYRNYLNLEYYREPLEGELRLLEVASRWARGEMDLARALENAALVSAEARAERLRSRPGCERAGIV